MIENKLNEEKRDDSKDIVTIDYYDRIHKQWIKLDVTKEVARLIKSEDQKTRRANNKYNYYYPSLIESSPKHIKNVVDLSGRWEYNKSKNPISQLQIECAYFNMLVKSYPSASFENIYSILTQMAKESYKEQLFRRFKGNLTQEKPLLTKKIARTIFNENKQPIQDSCLP